MQTQKELPAGSGADSIEIRGYTDRLGYTRCIAHAPNDLTTDAGGYPVALFDRAYQLAPDDSGRCDTCGAELFPLPARDQGNEWDEWIRERQDRVGAFNPSPSSGDSR